MKSFRSASSTMPGLLSLVFLYFLLIGLVLIFSDQILNDLSRSDAPISPAVIIAAVLLPLFLLAMIAVNLLRLLRDRTRRKPGVQFKSRLLLFFLFAILITSLPQAVLSVNFLHTAMNSWFSSRIGDSLRGGLNLALEYYDDKLAALNHFSQTQYLSRSIRANRSQPERIWAEIQDLQPEIAGLQVFDEEFREIYFAGDLRSRLQAETLQGRGDGLLPKLTTGDRTILQVLNTYVYSDGAYPVVLSTVLPRDFDRKASGLTASLETFTQLEKYQSVFKVAVGAFYSFFAIPLILLSILIAFLLSEEIIQPIVNLEEATRRVAEGDFSFRILTRSGDELAMLVSSFNRMVGELERYKVKITQTEKITAWQEIAQRLAHEIKNPLTPIKLSAERILRKYRTAPQELDRVLVPAVNAIISEVDNLNTLLTEFRNFAKLPSPQLRPVDLKALVTEVASMYVEHQGGVRIDLSGVEEGIVLQADQNQLKQVFANLFKNSLEAMSDGGEIFVRALLVKKGNSQYSRIQVQDSGAGIDPEHADQVFNPYFTTKKSGTGLGLAIVERIVFDHRGQIWLDAQADTGATFYIDLPLEP